MNYKEESVKDLQRLYASRITEIPANRPIQEVTERTATTASMVANEQANYLYDRRYNMVPSSEGTSNSKSHTFKESSVTHPGGSMKKMKLSYISPKGNEDRKFQCSNTKVQLT